MDIAVVGGGYVGSVTAACLASLSHSVMVLEIDPARLAALQTGTVPFYEPELGDVLSAGIATGRLAATGDPGVALRDRDAILVCVGTPLGPGGQADLTQVRSACDRIAEFADSASVVIVRSTLPLGMSQMLTSWIARIPVTRLATNPEFLREGTAVRDFLNPDRIVIGTPDGIATEASDAVVALYAGIEAPMLLTDLDSAEMIKNAANAFLATKLSFINEIADLCEAYGADIEDVIAGIGLDPRIGSAYLRPGIGFGGSCLPKEVANLVRLGKRRDAPMRMLGSAGEANDLRPAFIADRIERILGGVAGRRIALLGLAFKPDTDDVRYSPAISLARSLLARGAKVVAHDPAVTTTQSAAIPGLDRADSVAAAAENANIVVLATEWSEYRLLDWASIGDLVAERVLFDGRNALDQALLERDGWQVHRIGHRHSSEEDDLQVAAARAEAVS